jgi:tetratricopeptide (TPR) repeat protein
MKRHHNLFLAFAVLALLGGVLWVGRSALLGTGLLVTGLVGLAFLQRSTWFVYLAGRAHQSGDEAGTLRWFARAEGTGRLDAQTTATYLYLLLKDGSLDEARTLADRSLADGVRGKALKSQDRKLIESYQSLVLWKSGQLDQAVELLEGLLTTGYRTRTLYGNLGFFLVEQGNLARAEALCLEAVEWDPEGKVLLDNLGSVYLAQERWTDAAEVYRKLLDLDPKFPEAWHGAGRAFLAAGDAVEARRCWEKALELPFNALTTVERTQVERALETI